MDAPPNFGVSMKPEVSSYPQLTLNRYKEKIMKVDFQVNSFSSSSSPLHTYNLLINYIQLIATLLWPWTFR